MAKAKAPLFSFQARGSVGKVLTFRESARQHVVSTLTDHPDARSAAQLTQRLSYTHAKTYWHTLAAAEKAALLTSGRPENITGYNLLLRQYLNDLLDLELWLPLNDQVLTAARDLSPHKGVFVYEDGAHATDFCGNVNNALALNGVDEWVDGSAPQTLFTSQDFTIVARVKLDNFTSHPMVLDNAVFNTSGYRFFVSNTGSLRIETYHEAPGEYTFTPNNKVPAGSWHTVACSRQGATCWCYVDGVDETSAHGTHVDPAPIAANTYIGINRNQSAQELDGIICDVKVFSRLFTSAEHLLLHQRACVPPY